MIQEDQKDRTYIKNREIATWYFVVDSCPASINLYNAEERAPWFASLAACSLSALTGFAQVDSIDVTTDSQGDDAFAIKPYSLAEMRRLDLFLRTTLDVFKINAWLSLQCVQINSLGIKEEFLLPNNGWLSIENNISKFGSTEDGLACVFFSLETNIYSPIAGGDNRGLAALNAPRLRNFLRGLEEIPSLKFDKIDDPVGHIKRAQKYGVVDRCGFKMPSDAHAFEELLKHESIKS